MGQQLLPLWVQVMPSFSSFPGEKGSSALRKCGSWLFGKPWKQNSNCFAITAESIRLCCSFWFSQNCYPSESPSGTRQSRRGKKSLAAKKQLFRPNLWIKLSLIVLVCGFFFSQFPSKVCLFTPLNNHSAFWALGEVSMGSGSCEDARTYFREPCPPKSTLVMLLLLWQWCFSI